MRTHTTAWITSFILIVAIATGARYYSYIIKKDYLLEANTTCDTATGDCFVADCNSDDPDCDLAPYKKVEIVANEAPKCLEEHTCETFSCEGLEECSLTYCSDETIEEGERCQTLEESEGVEVINENLDATSNTTE
jgi:hypothetical protein